MKKKLFGTLACALGCIFSLGAEEPVQRFEFEYLYVTPAHTDKSHQFRILYKVNTNFGSTKDWMAQSYVYNEKYPKGTNFKNLWVRNDIGTSDTYCSGNTFVAGKPNQLKIFFTDKDKTRTTYFIDCIYDDSYPYLKVQDLPLGVYEARNIKGYEKGVGYLDTTNRYVFRDWYAENHLSVYNKIDIGMFSFEEFIGQAKVNLTYYMFQLGIPANYGLFDDLTDDELSSNRIVFDLNLVDDGTYHYTLQLNQKIYVNPFTYQMSRQPKNGYVETKYIYLPKTGFSDLNKLYFEIKGEQLGTMHLNFEYKFSVQSSKSRIGDCVSSEYCIKGEDARYSEFGKELSHD